MEHARRGQAIYNDRSFGEREIACADCHTDFADHLQPEDRIYPGHALLGAAKRRAAWNGSIAGDAMAWTASGAARCAVRFQKRAAKEEDALTKEDASALLAFYAAISTGSEPLALRWTALPYSVDSGAFEDTLRIELERIASLRGDAARGSVLFRAACTTCHGGGLELGPSPRMLRKEIETLSKHVRIGYKTMPFFSRDKLSAQDIADIRDYVGAGM